MLQLAAMRQRPPISCGTGILSESLTLFSGGLCCLTCLGGLFSRFMEGSSMRLLVALTAFVCCGLSNGRLEAALIGFEGVAPASGFVHQTTYSEATYTFTSTGLTTLFVDKDSAINMDSHDSDSFALANPSFVTLTGTAPFNVGFLRVGRQAGFLGLVDLTITGNFFGGGSASHVFTSIGAATTIDANFSNLVSAVFTTSSSLAPVYFDNVNVTASAPAAVPEPASAAALCLGSLALVVRRLRRRSSVVA
jgi:hypothetical protein